MIVTAWTTSINPAQLPEGAVIPVVDSPGDIVNKENFIMELLADTLDDAVPATGFANVGAAVKTEIDTNWLSDVFGLDPLAAMTGRIVITKVVRDFDSFKHGDFANQYQTAAQVFVVEGRFEWSID